MADAVDWTDPCAKAKALRDAYYALITGEQESVIRQRTGESETEIRFPATDVKRLYAEMTTAEADCAASQGMTITRRRYAITGGSYR